ncbi:MAG: 2'-5' RNA ligase family protein [Candidatus Daviesbacteria bacterium]|nr:2'-5' RNA ligase family protein [Candidatus Daviesbacteria bacterium]
MKTSGYTINIIPPAGIYDKFDEIIKKLAGKYGTFKFAPHITVLGQASDSKETAIKLMEQVTSNQKPFTVTLNKVGFQDFFFRALYVLAEKTAPLAELHRKAKMIFNKEAAPYMPHLSLLYGDFAPEIKEKIIQEIGSEQPTTFIVSSLHLFRTEGESNEWYSVAKFPFKD